MQELAERKSTQAAASRWFPAATAIFAAGTFIADTLTHLDIAVAVLYVVVLLLASRFCPPRGLFWVCAGCVFLTGLSFVLSPGAKAETGLVNSLISVLTIVLTTVLVARGLKAEATTREQAGLLELTHDAIVSETLDGRIVYWNHGASEVYGWDAASAVGKSAQELLQTRLPVPLDQIMAELVAKDRWQGELSRKKRDGSEALVDTRWSLLRDARGEPAAILETSTDITARRRAQEALQQAQADLARTNRILVLGEMTASIAHEVSQPITAARSNADAGVRYLGARTPAVEKARAAFAAIVEDCTRAIAVIGRVRGMVKKAPPNTERFDLGDVIRETLAVTGHELDKAGVALSTRVSRDAAAVLADRIQVQQVILNLIKNAVDAMSGVRDRPRELTIVCEGDGPASVAVEVRDTGTGIRGSADQLFQSFYTTKSDGMGMGLAISRAIVEAHGGRLSAGLNEPHGAVFRFTLPTDRRA